jgi:4-hydroxy-2-oxoheptanedioate aldolase
MARPSIKTTWLAGEPTLGAWLSLPSTVAAEAVARLGFGFVNVDMQHGLIDYQKALEILQVLDHGSAPPIVRVPVNEPGIIGKMLDAGAMGVIVPMVNSRAEAEAVVRSCRYAPQGSRSFGPTRAAMADTDYFANANTDIATIPMIETVEAIKNLDDILSVPGLDAIYVGPADLSVTLGLPPGNNDDDAEFTAALLTITAACRRHGVVAGIHANVALCEKRLEQGFQMITVSADLLAMRTQMAADLAAVSGTAAAQSRSLY